MFEIFQQNVVSICHICSYEIFEKKPIFIGEPIQTVCIVANILQTGIKFYKIDTIKVIFVRAGIFLFVLLFELHEPVLRLQRFLNNY